jgi:ParB-like chromosome segregation protein Spo0J
MSQEVLLIKLDEIKIAKYNARKNDIKVGIEELAANIRAIGLLQPITVYQNSDDKKYVIIAGQRRFNAHVYLNEKYPGKRFGRDKQLPDEIKCLVIDEPKTQEEKTAISVAENITHLHMTNADTVKAVTDLWKKYHDYELIEEECGLTKYMIDKYVALARLPDEIKDLINEGGIHSNQKTAENNALRAVDSLGWIKDQGDPTIRDVIDFAIALGDDEEGYEGSDLEDEGKKGGSLEDMKNRAKKRSKTTYKLKLTEELAKGLSKVSEHKGEKEATTLTGYINKGVTDDLKELDYE